MPNLLLASLNLFLIYTYSHIRKRFNDMSSVGTDGHKESPDGTLSSHSRKTTI